MPFCSRYSERPRSWKLGSLSSFQRAKASQERFSCCSSHWRLHSKHVNFLHTLQRIRLCGGKSCQIQPFGGSLHCIRLRYRLASIKLQMVFTNILRNRVSCFIHIISFNTFRKLQTYNNFLYAKSPPYIACTLNTIYKILKIYNVARNGIY